MRKTSSLRYNRKFDSCFAVFSSFRMFIGKSLEKKNCIDLGCSGNFENSAIIEFSSRKCDQF